MRPQVKWRRIRRVLRILALTAVTSPLIIYLGFSAAVAWWPYPNDVDRPPPPATIVNDRSGVALAAFAAADGQWRLPLRDEKINPHLLNAIVAVEDARFFDHAGVDWQAVAAAAWQNATALGVRRGASTLTMQLHRLRDPATRTLWNKFEQAVRARQIEATLDKRAILIEYANRAPFGGNLVGAGAASWRYFGKPCSQLSLGEAALLAGLPQNPNRFRPDRFPHRAGRRRDHVLDRMLACGMIAEAQQAHAKAEPIRAEWRPLPQNRENASGAMPTLVQFAGRSSSENGMIDTTLDAGVQHQVFRATCDQLAKLQSDGVSAAAVVVLDTQTGECLATVSVSPSDSASIDLTRRPRSTGSVLKPLIYAAAFEAGICGPESTLDDSPTAWPGYTPQDYDQKFRGQMTAAEALAESRNIPALVLLARTGVGQAEGVMASAGLNTLAQSGRTYGLSLAIGGAEATPMEVAKAYAGMARGGTSWPTSNRRFGEFFPLPPEEGQGEGMSDVKWRSSTSNTPSPQPSPGGRGSKRFLAQEACWQVMHALSDPDRTAVLSRTAANLNVAWKTGTSSGHRDAWCAAATSRRTVVVWLGNAGGEASPVLVGRDAAAPLALQILSTLDDTPTIWPVSSSSDGTLVASHRLGQRTTLAIVSPAPGRDILLSDDVPAERQRVPLRAAGGSGEIFHWFVDGDHLGASSPLAPLWWNPVAGEHEIRAVDDHGAAAVISIKVHAD